MFDRTGDGFARATSIVCCALGSDSSPHVTQAERNFWCWTGGSRTSMAIFRRARVFATRLNGAIHPARRRVAQSLSSYGSSIWLTERRSQSRPLTCSSMLRPTGSALRSCRCLSIPAKTCRSKNGYQARQSRLMLREVWRSSCWTVRSEKTAPAFNLSPGSVCRAVPRQRRSLVKRVPQSGLNAAIWQSYRQHRAISPRRERTATGLVPRIPSKRPSVHDCRKRRAEC